MLSLVDPKVDEYCLNHTTPLGEISDDLAEETREKSEWSIMMIGPLQGRLLNLLARMVQAKRILEIGTFSGYSALAMAEALPDDGVIITCDVNESTVDIGKAHWSRSEHGKKIESRLGPAHPGDRDGRGETRIPWARTATYGNCRCSRRRRWLRYREGPFRVHGRHRPMCRFLALSLQPRCGPRARPEPSDW